MLSKGSIQRISFLIFRGQIFQLLPFINIYTYAIFNSFINFNHKQYQDIYIYNNIQTEISHKSLYYNNQQLDVNSFKN